MNTTVLIENTVISIPYHSTSKSRIEDRTLGWDSTHFFPKWCRQRHQLFRVLPSYGAAELSSYSSPKQKTYCLKTQASVFSRRTMPHYWTELGTSFPGWPYSRKRRMVLFLCSWFVEKVLPRHKIVKEKQNRKVQVSSINHVNRVRSAADGQHRWGEFPTDSKPLYHCWVNRLVLLNYLVLYCSSPGMSIDLVFLPKISRWSSASGWWWWFHGRCWRSGSSNITDRSQRWCLFRDWKD